MKFRIRYADQVVGVFVILAFIILAGTIVLVGANNRWFARDYRFESRFASSSGLSVGTPILLKGFQIGRIDTIELTSKNEARVTIAIFDTYADRVRLNSLMEYVTSPIGLGSQLLFHPGKSTALAEEGSFIPSFDTPEGKKLVEADLVNRPPKDDTITRLLSNMNPLIENVNATVEELQITVALVNDVLAGKGIGPIAAALDDTAKTISGVKTLVANVDRLVVNADDLLGTTGTRADSIISEVEQSVPTMLAQVESAVVSARDTVDSVSAIAANLEKTSASLADPTGLVPKLLDPKGSIKTLLDDNGVLFGRVDGSLAQVEAALSNLNDATASFSDQMPRIVGVIEQARGAIVKAEDVMEGLKNNPLLRGGIPERVENTSAPSGARTTDF